MDWYAAASGPEHDLIRYLDRMEMESDARRAETGVKDAELNLRYYRGDSSAAEALGGAMIGGGSNMQYKFTLNLIGNLVKRKAALITDSRPTMRVESRVGNQRRGTAETFQKTVMAVWDEQSLEQAFTYELVRSEILGAVLCVPAWDPSADYGRGDIRLRFYDPRAYAFDPSVTRSRELQRTGEFLQVKEMVSLGRAAEMFPARALDLRPNSRYSQFGQAMDAGGSGGFFSRLLAPLQQAWTGQREALPAAMPRTVFRHSWFKDFQRDARNEPIFGRPRIIRHVVDDGQIVLADAPQQALHGQLPGHIMDWDIELDHAWGMSEIYGLRRIQYTLNRLVGQIVENTLLTNRVMVTADTDAVDQKTWEALTAGKNGVFIRKKIGRTISITNPAVLPAYLISLVTLLIQSIDLVSGINDATRGQRPPGVISGAAISELAQQAQTIIRLEARAFEDWLTRIFQQVLPLIWQYYTTPRMLSFVGANLELVQFEFDRKKFLTEFGVDGEATLPRDAWQDFAFKVIPGSSLASTRMQRGVAAMNLHMAGLLPGKEVLRAAEWPDPEATVQEARKERAELGPLALPFNTKRPVKMPGATRT